MKVRKESKGYMGFNPFDIILTVESEEEARAFYAIFNYSPNLNLLLEKEDDSIRCTIGEEFSVNRSEEVIAKGVTYHDFYRPKTK